MMGALDELQELIGEAGDDAEAERASSVRLTKVRHGTHRGPPPPVRYGKKFAWPEVAANKDRVQEWEVNRAALPKRPPGAK